MRQALKPTILIIVASVLSSGIFGEGQAHKQSKYDGHWWLSISPKEQDGFIRGYDDCYTYEYKGSDRYEAKSYSAYEMLITDYCRHDPSGQYLTIPEVLHGFRDRPGEKPPSGGEMIRGRHGYFDGLYWKQIGALDGNVARVGFVEGYLSCHAELADDRGGIFSKPPTEYTALITRWYGINDEMGDIDGKREPTKVADVLFKFRDHLPRPEH